MIPVNDLKVLELFEGSVVCVQFPSSINYSASNISFGLILYSSAAKSNRLYMCNKWIFDPGEKIFSDFYKMRFASFEEISEIANKNVGGFKLYNELEWRCYNWDDIKAQFKKRYVCERAFLFGSKDSNSILSLLPKDVIKIILSKSIYILAPCNVKLRTPYTPW